MARSDSHQRDAEWVDDQQLRQGPWLDFVVSPDHVLGPQHQLHVEVELGTEEQSNELRQQEKPLPIRYRRTIRQLARDAG